MNSNNETALLQEYSTCDSQVSRIDTIIWQTAALIFPITLAALAYFGKSSDQTIRGLLIECVVATGAVSIVTIWYRLTLQWHGYQSIAFYRMKEIELELGMLH